MISFTAFTEQGFPRNILDFLAFLSLAITSFAAYLAIMIFRNQETQARVHAAEQKNLLEEIRLISEAAERNSGSANDKVRVLIRLFNKSQKSKSKPPLTQEQVAHVQAASAVPIKNAAQILWVDDNPEWVSLERETFETGGLPSVLVSTTTQALELLDKNTFSVVITDMGRVEGEREGYVLLDAMRARHDTTPLIVYSSSRHPEHVAEVRKHGGQGATNEPFELFELVMKEVIGFNA
ncbi:response regulator [Mycetocola spongiae]|uniref:response regulator n=1 Tax=Mycetocola spongiae TaxID=2859226 RepID=UPI001CF2556A|nr:response regulator [Mycetocola spongiae]UCR89010.1 response regulator [Mycetocola spongiae]